MKLKNSYILLIAVIMLLIGIGSVCASEDVTDSDKLLTSSETDMTLTDGENTTQEKINTTVNIPEDTYRFNESDAKSIPINVTDNESEEIEFADSDLTITEGNNTIAFTRENGTINFQTPFAVGNYSLSITYKGNDTYASSMKNITLLISHAKTLEIPSTVVSETGTSVTIPVIVDDGLENYTVKDSDLKVSISYIDDEGNIQTKDVAYSQDGQNNITVNLGIATFIEANITVNYTETSSLKTASIKLLTSVEASEPKIYTTENKIITVTVNDGSSNPITVTQGDFKVYEGSSELQFGYSEGNITIGTPMDIGNHNITIVYNGNGTYAETNKSVILGVYGNSTFDVENSTNVDNDKKINLQTNLTNGIDPVDIVKENMNITVNYIDAAGEAQSFNVTSFDVQGQVVSFTFDKTFTSANLTVTYTTNEGVTTVKDVIVKVNTVINAENEIIKGNEETLTITSNVTSDDGAELIINNDTFKIYNGNTQLNTTYSDGVFTIHNNLTYGVYNLTIKFTGNSTYSDAEKNITLKIIGFNTNNVTEVKVNSTKEFEIKLNVTDGETIYNITQSDLNITASYVNSTNETVNLTLTVKSLENNTLVLVCDNLNFTTANLTIRYNNNTKAHLTLKRIYNVRIEVINNKAEYQSGNFTYKLVDIDNPETPIANKSVQLEYRVMGGSITFQQTITEHTDENGIVVFNNSKIFVAYFNLVLDVGENEVTIKNDDFVIENGAQKVNITKATIGITIDPYKEYYNSDKKVEIHVYNANTKDPMKFITLHLYMSNSSAKDYYFQTNENGTAEISVNGLVGGTYPITVNNNDTTNMTSVKVSGKIVIVKIPVKINAKDVTMYYNSGTTSTIKITKDGKAVSGVYVLVRLYSTSKKYNDYLFQTNSKGQISFSAPLNVGKHKMIVVLADNRYDAKQVTKTVSVKKASAKITASKGTIYYKSAFTAKVTNSKNKKAIYGAKLNIKFYVSSNRYYNFNGQTGADGKVRLTMNLKPGSYRVVIKGTETKNYKAPQITTKIVVKKTPTKLTPKKITAKKGAKKYFQVKLTNKKTKKAISGEKVKIKIKSKTYTVKTNSKGIAKVSTKSLKVGTYKVTTSFSAKYFSSSKAKSTIKITR